jgi:hypothetical protein
MADSFITINPGSGGPKLDTDEVGGEHQQKIQVTNLGGLDALSGGLKVSLQIPPAANRIHRVRNLTGSNNTAWTSVGGLALYVTNLNMVGHNTDVTTLGQISILDGGTGGTLMFQWNFPTRAAGTNAVVVNANLSFPTPVVFTTDVFLRIDAGVMRWNSHFTGWEQ